MKRKRKKKGGIRGGGGGGGGWDLWDLETQRLLGCSSILSEVRALLRSLNPMDFHGTVRSLEL